MGLNLNQRRLLESFQENEYKGLKAEIVEAIGFEVKLEPKWDTLFLGTEQMNDDTIKSCWADHYFKPLAYAFKDLCRDKMGKAAVKENLKKIVIDGSNDTTNPKASTFKEGIFTVNHKPAAYSCSVAERGQSWSELIAEKI